MAVSDLALVLGGIVDAMRGHDPAQIADLLDPDVVWTGAHPGTRCDGRKQAMDIIGPRLRATALVVDGVEAIAGEHAVLVAMSGPGFNATLGDRVSVGTMYQVFTVRAGKVVAWHDYVDRQQALAAAGIAAAR